MKTPELHVRNMAKIPHPENQEDIRKRLKALIVDRYNGRQGELAEATGIQRAALSNILSGKNEASIKQLRQIERVSLARFVWLTTGEEPIYHNSDWVPPQLEALRQGENLRMFLNKHRKDFSQRQLGDAIGVTPQTISSYFDTATFDEATKSSILKGIQLLLNDSEITEEQVYGSTRIVLNYNANPIGENERLMRNVGNFSAEPIIRLPSVPIRARAGIPTAQFWEQPLETFSIMRATLLQYEPDPHRFRKDWWIIEVDGDSMEPQLRSRSRVLGYYVGKRVDGGEWEIDFDQLSHLKPGVWAVQYDDDFVIKRVIENTLKRDKQLLLHSDNPPPGPFAIRANSIRHVWFIETVIDSPVR